MKKDNTTFTCDKCGKEVIKEKGTGFPYEKGWCYIYRFNGKLLQSYTPAIELEVGKFELKDKHFCSKECMVAIIGEAIKEAEEDKVEE